jgi:hypothetical protein
MHSDEDVSLEMSKNIRKSIDGPVGPDIMAPLAGDMD